MISFMRDATLLTAAISELSASEERTLLARTERSTEGRATELRPRLREAVRERELAPEDVLRRLDEEGLESLLEHAGVELPGKTKHAELLQRIAVLIREELDAPRPRTRRARSHGGGHEGEDLSELERLREDVDRLLDERARLEAKSISLRRELDRLRGEVHAQEGLDNTPADLAELLRGMGIADVRSYKLLYRSAAKLLHPDKNPEGERAFRLLTKIRDLLEGKV
jgi:hypothetical protein